MRPVVEAMLGGEIATAAELVEQFLARAGSRAAVFADLMQPAQYEIGERWYRGQASIEDEHRAATILRRLAMMLPPTPARSPVPAGSRCLLTVMPGEQHTLGLSMLALALEDEGWEVELLDSDCQPHDLPDLVERTRPRVVGISAGFLSSPQRMAAVVSAILALQVPVMVGGVAFNRAADTWHRVGATACGADARIGTVLARRLMRA